MAVGILGVSLMSLAADVNRSCLGFSLSVACFFYMILIY